MYVTVANGVWSKENDQVKNLVSQLRVAEAVNLQQVHVQREKYIESVDKIKKKIRNNFFFFYFLENYSRRVRK